MFGWVAEGRTEKVQRRAGWSGIMCLPRVLSLDPDGGLRVAPVPDHELLRRERIRLTDVVVPPAIGVPLGSIMGDCIEVELDVGDAREIGLKVLCSPHEAEQTVISYTQEDSSVSIDVAKGCLSEDMVGRDMQRDFVELAEGEPLRPHIFVDRSIVEVFDGRGLGLTKRVCPTRADSRGIRLFAMGGDARIRSLDVWEMASAN
jgi:beta-fructofuranosidase